MCVCEIERERERKKKKDRGERRGKERVKAAVRVCTGVWGWDQPRPWVLRWWLAWCLCGQLAK